MPQFAPSSRLVRAAGSSCRYVTRDATSPSDSAPKPRPVTGSGPKRFATAGTASGPGGTADREFARGDAIPKLHELLDGFVT